MATEIHSAPAWNPNCHSMDQAWSFSNSHLCFIHMCQQETWGPSINLDSQLCFPHWWKRALPPSHFLDPALGRSDQPFLSLSQHHEATLPSLWLLSISDPSVRYPHIYLRISYLEFFITNCEMYLVLIPEHGVSYSHLPSSSHIFRILEILSIGPWVRWGRVTLIIRNCYKCSKYESQLLSISYRILFHTRLISVYL